MSVKHLTLEELEVELMQIAQSPKDSGRLELIVRRPGVDKRETLYEGLLDPVHGLQGDAWGARASSVMADGASDLDRQLTLMNSRVISLLAQTKDRWPLAGDQLYVDFDLSAANAPPGTRLQIGSAIVQVTAEPHNGCSKFCAKFGKDALTFVNAPARKALRLRGVNARVIQAGVIKTGDSIEKVSNSFREERLG